MPIRIEREVRRMRWQSDSRRVHQPVRVGKRLFHWLSSYVRRKALSVVVASALGLRLSAAANAAFQNEFISPHAAAMGGSSVAGMGESSSIFLNPANLANIKSPESFFMYHQLYAGLKGVGSINQGLLSAGVPTRLGVIGIGIGDFRAEGLLEERVFGVGISRPLTDYLSAGVAAKYMYHDYLIGSDPLAQADPVFSHGSSRGAASFDAGIVASLAARLTLGAAVRNINQPNVGLDSTDRVPRVYSVGLAYEVIPASLRVTIDTSYRDERSGNVRDRLTPSVGIEKSLVGDLVKFRLGGSRDQITGGVGLQYGSFGLDYAFSINLGLLADNGGSHLLGIRYRFGGSSASASASAARPNTASTSPILANTERKL